ncbi:hypothetical protein [Streptomyces sp. NBC_00102]|uniref:hypothetical protein n=1 Tax=Streptomyces sp. NBC_00102 TaxID=2975652 RepID=UPI002256FBAD|nr:hypothetical protein [Streptomyces sp. NBC_00102]MCX5400941.1 hypothetical protein [Streptomyces sp. NBC_00102]
MGTYNLLTVPRPQPCTKCGSTADLVIQFHFGGVRLRNLSIGDAVDWSGKTKGSPQKGRSDVLGYPEPCPACGFDDDRLCVVEFDGDVITGYRRAEEADLMRLEQ